MATKKGADSKKGTAPKTKKKPLVANDPPIVISGGGGVSKRQQAKNKIRIKFTGKFGGNNNPEAKNNGDDITGVTVEVVGKSGGTTSSPQTIVFDESWDSYHVTVTFNT